MAIHQTVTERPTCVDCAADAPETETNYTLISSTFGWRLARRRLPGGAVSVEWRCAACWRNHKDSARRRVAPTSCEVSAPKL